MRAVDPARGAVPKLIDSGDSPTPWIAMERIAGTNVADICADGIKPHEAVPLGVAILDALEAIHAAKFVHRDLKPDNLVRVGDRVVILDLGLARKLPSDPDDPNRANVQVGSLEYMAPEQIADSTRVDERSDIYAFGCILYELIAGRPPFVGDAQVLERAHTALRPPRLNALVTVPAAIDALVADCLAKDPARRPQTVAEVKSRLVVSRDERTPPKLQHSMSVIREGKQPVVLLWAELPRVDRALLGMLTGRRLMIASQRGRKVLAAVLGGEHADPAAVAIATARDLAAAGARVALHLEALRVASGTLQGEPVDKPETWLPTDAWSGVVLTASLAAVTQARTADGPPGFRVLTDETQTVELIGREALLTDLVGDAAVALYGGADTANPGRRARRGSSMSGVFGPQGPGFALLVGDPGAGKTAFLGELARRLRELGVRVHLGAVPPPGTGKAGALSELVGPLQGVRALGDAIRRTAHDTPTAILLDDLHFGEHELFDALEYATLGGEALPLWICATAAPRIDARRPNLGERAQRHRRDVLAPLDEDAAVALTAALLRPAEYPPLRALRRLATIAHGNPLHLVMLAREIHQRGAIRERAGGAYFLDTSALDELSPVALGPWLAARELAGLGDELVALARLCAVLGGEVTRDELVAVVEAAERQGAATTTIDVDIGLRELVTAGVLMQTEHGYAFRQALVEEGVYATTNEEERRAFHRTALSTLTLSPSTAERVAHHADALDDHETAGRAHAVLGERAIAEHRPLDADQSWSAALRHRPDPSPARMTALMMRSEARYRTQRVRDALADLDEAARIAHAIGDRDVEARIELQRATALDWADDWDGSAAAAARARELLGDTPSVDADLAEARSLFRAGKFDEAQPKLAAVRVEARAQHKTETEIIARLLESTALVDLGRYDEATRAFEELIPLCEQNDDRFHLGVAYANRSWLWSVQGETERCNEDLRTVIQLAREIGHAQVERIATYNLGEALLWQGSLDEALRLARRSEALQLGHGEGAAKLDELLIARVLAARGDTAELANILQVLGRQALSPNEQAVFDILSGGKWEDLLRSEHLTVENRLELGQLALRAGVLDAERRQELAALQAAHPLWSKLPVAFL